TPYVVLPLADYEFLLDLPDKKISALNEVELLEKINREISLWKIGQEGGNFSADSLAQKEKKEVCLENWGEENRNEGKIAEDDSDLAEADWDEEGNLTEEKEGVGDDQYYFEPLEA
ncbi:MAG: hypothetical protein HY982_02870, partial [Candidatus Magasanikbacteria bacterium]|nr:hypothetical protein [Candidatus Magasanikbacteria bacterium]